MLRHFPKEQPAEWAYICECSGKDETTAVQSFIEANLEGETLLVEVHRSIGAALSRNEAASFIAAHICKADIRVSNRAFTSVAIFARNGVAAAWRVAAQPSLPPDVHAAASRQHGRG